METFLTQGCEPIALQSWDLPCGRGLFTWQAMSMSCYPNLCSNSRNPSAVGSVRLCDVDTYAMWPTTCRTILSFVLKSGRTVTFSLNLYDVQEFSCRLDTEMAGTCGKDRNVVGQPSCSSFPCPSSSSSSSSSFSSTFSTGPIKTATSQSSRALEHKLKKSKTMRQVARRSLAGQKDEVKPKDEKKKEKGK